MGDVHIDSLFFLCYSYRMANYKFMPVTFGGKLKGGLKKPEKNCLQRFRNCVKDSKAMMKKTTPGF